MMSIKNRIEKLIVIVIEANSVFQHYMKNTKNGFIELEQTRVMWDPSPFTNDPTGIRLLEEIYRKINIQIEKTGEKPQGIALSVPGTLKNNNIIIRSSRLGILEHLDI